MNHELIVTFQANGLAPRRGDKCSAGYLFPNRPGHWPAPGSEDTELGVSMEPEVDHGEAEVHTRVQA
jgi:hypothetical protein